MKQYLNCTMIVYKREASGDCLVQSRPSDAQYHTNIEMGQLRLIGRQSFLVNQVTNHQVYHSPSSKFNTLQHVVEEASKATPPYTPRWLYFDRAYTYWKNGWAPKILSCRLFLAALVGLITTLRYLENCF